jgi:Lrp/AsnC family transcriptional regulator, regulator for asnA, asnC and gidA
MAICVAKMPFMSTQEIDALDWAIVAQLSRNARLSTRKIASKLPLSEATVRRRLKRLASADTISLRAMVDPTFLGFDVQAIIGLEVQVELADKVMKKLSEFDNIIYCAALAGRFDVVLIGLFSSVDDMLKFMERQVGTLDGVQGSETLVCLRVEKGEHVFMGSQAEKRASPLPEGRTRRKRR